MSFENVTTIDEMREIFMDKIKSEFDENDYTDFGGEVVLDNIGSSVSFGNNITVIFNYAKPDQKVIPIEYESGEWIVLPYTDCNDSDYPAKFDEDYLNEIIQHFKELSK